MPLINVIEIENATGVVAEVYREIGETFGFVPNAIKLDSLNPEQMSRHWHAIKQSLQHPSLSQKLFAMIRMLISEAQRCEYCIGLNAGMLIQMHGMTQDQVSEVIRDPNSAPLDEKEKTLLLFVVNATNDSNGVTEEMLDELKAKGCTEREIYDALNHGAQQVAGDIILNAFKVEADLH